MRIDLLLPDKYRLAGLEQGHKGWTCYLQLKNGGYLQGRVATTPQQAIDDCTAAMDRYVPSIETSRDLSHLDIDLTDIQL